MTVVPTVESCKEQIMDKPVGILMALALGFGVLGCSGQETAAPENAEAPATETASADQEPATSTPQEPAGVFAEAGVAIAGADPVAYFTQNEYVPGEPAYTYEWGGATWQFANAEHRDLFAQNPEQYAPEYGGFCAWAVSQGNTAPIDPTAWKIVDNKLYLNYSQKVQERWAQDIPGNVAKADQNWPGVLEE